jgi:hypothetical protein
VQSAGEFRVIGKSDVDAVLGFEKQTDLLGCTDTSCFAELGGASGVDMLVDVQVGESGASWAVTMKLIDVKQGEPTVEARIAEPAVAEAATDLSGPDALSFAR